MEDRHIKKRYLVAAIIIAVVFLLILCLQNFMLGKIIPAPEEQELVISKPNAATDNIHKLKTGYYKTVWPSEHADLIRSHAVLSGGLTKNFDKSRLKVAATQLYLPTWGYTRGKDEIFVIGGSPQFMTIFTESIKDGKSLSRLTAMIKSISDIFSPDISYVAKLNSKTLEKTVLALDRGNTVNYTGGLLMHANGYVYAVSRSVLYKIEPIKMAIVKSIDLPLIGNRLTRYWTTYNGLQVLPNGEMVLKGFHLINNANLDGCLLLIDPETLQIDVKQKVRVSSARLMIADDYLYHVNAEESLRFKITDRGFVLDKDFTAKYRSKNDPGTQASSPLLLPEINMVVFADNTAPNARTPLKLYAKSTKDKNSQMQSANAFTTATPSFNFFMIAGDPFINNIVIYYDPLNNRVSANKIFADGSIKLLWEKVNIKASASPAISAADGHIYIDDYKNGKDNFIVLDLLTGKERGRVELSASLPTVGTIFIGENADVFILNSEAGKDNGFVSRIFVQ
jgi:outer membrane protein assembly factor BamB